MKAVLAAAKKVEELLATLAVRVVVDDNNNYKPGPRMKHWEERGVPVRVEIGPQDVAKGSCVVARSMPGDEPGTVAQKTTVKMSNMLIKHVRKALLEAGVELEQAMPSVDGGPKSENATAGESVSEEEDEEDGEEVTAARDAGGAASTIGPSGDDMDDFSLHDIEREEDALMLTKKDLAKRKRKEDKAKRKAAKAVSSPAAEVEEAEKKNEPWKKPRKPKTVLFKA